MRKASREVMDLSWSNRQLLIEIDELLSEIAYKILTQQQAEWREPFLHEIAVHLLFNMLTKQEFFKSYQFQQGKHRDIIRLMTDNSAAMFRELLDRKKYEDKLGTTTLKAVFFYDSCHIESESPHPLGVG